MKVKLGDLLKVEHGFAFKSENYVDNGNTVLVTLGNISDKNSFKINEDKITFYGADYPEEYNLVEGDLIMPLTEQVVGLFGNTAFVPKYKNYQFVLNQRVGKVIVDKTKTNKDFIHHLLALDYVKNQLEARASGTRQRNISPESIYDVSVYVPSLEKQNKIGDILKSIESQIERNNAMVQKLQVLGHTIYSDTFRDCKTTCSLMNFPYIHLIKQGIDVFKGKKHYIATANVVDDNLNFDTSKITFDNREGRANMQPIKNSVWFAQMKNSVKHIFVSDNDDYLVDNYIFSTGFYGFQCDDIAYEFMVETISLPYFEKVKDKMANGAIMASINSDSLHLIEIPSPTIEQLSAYHERVKDIYMQISAIKTESHKLSKLKEKLLPLLINGQLSV